MPCRRSAALVARNPFMCAPAQSGSALLRQRTLGATAYGSVAPAPASSAPAFPICLSAQRISAAQIAQARRIAASGHNRSQLPLKEKRQHGPTSTALANAPLSSAKSQGVFLPSRCMPLHAAQRATCASARDIGSGQAKVRSACVLEGRSPVIVPRGDVRAVGDQQRHHIVLPLSGGKMQRG